MSGTKTDSAVTKGIIILLTLYFYAHYQIVSFERLELMALISHKVD